LFDAALLLSRGRIGAPQDRRAVIIKIIDKFIPQIPL